MSWRTLARTAVHAALAVSPRAIKLPIYRYAFGFNIAGVNQAAGEAGQTANQVLQSADELSRQSVKLRADVDQFLQRIRAA